MKIKFKWEKIFANEVRTKVFGERVVLSRNEDGFDMVFIPDANHKWQI